MTWVDGSRASARRRASVPARGKCAGGTRVEPHARREATPTQGPSPCGEPEAPDTVPAARSGLSLLDANVPRGLRIVRCKMRKEVLCVLVVLLGGWAQAQQAPSAAASPASYPTPPRTSPQVPAAPCDPFAAKEGTSAP